MATDSPIGGAVVTITMAGAEPPRNNAPSRSVLTTADGYFVAATSLLASAPARAVTL